MVLQVYARVSDHHRRPRSDMESLSVGCGSSFSVCRRLGMSQESCHWKLYVPPVSARLVTLGIGMMFMKNCPLGLSRFAGMTFPGKGACVVGSVMTRRLPAWSNDCEKSPPRSSAVGVVTYWMGWGRLVCQSSSA